MYGSSVILSIAKLGFDRKEEPEISETICVVAQNVFRQCVKESGNTITPKDASTVSVSISCTLNALNKLGFKAYNMDRELSSAFEEMLSHCVQDLDPFGVAQLLQA